MVQYTTKKSFTERLRPVNTLKLKALIYTSPLLHQTLIRRILRHAIDGTIWQLMDEKCSNVVLLYYINRGCIYINFIDVPILLA